ncbi:MAG TPA: PEGA domain-containing protein [Isosphaeraceae bacterium]|jgi:hypothetical protein|nr:PEGA domain-containing protein [Isosphaeraceae bacterium]
MAADRACSRRHWLAVGLASLWLVGLTGCVHRRYTIRTDPPGAVAIVNGKEVGPTPVSVNYTFYKEHEIVLMLEGYQTQRIIQPIPAPWWDSLPLEFFVENVVPISLRDEREFQYKMVPATNPPISDLLGRGQELKTKAQVGPPPRRGGILGFFGF